MKKLLAMTLSVGITMMVFAGCGANQQDPATVVCSHQYVSTVIKEPSYESEGETAYTCSKCGDTYTERIEKLTRHVVPTSVLDEALSSSRYHSSAFSISVGQLVNAAMDNYKVQYLSGEEALSKGYITDNQIDSSVDVNYLYYAIISGDTMMNPELPYLTNYENEAVKVWMIFDDRDQLVNSGVTLCSNLQTCAILIMSNGY